MPPTNKKGDKIVMVQMPKEMWHHLKWLSFKMNISMAEIARRGIENFLKDSEKEHGTP